MKASIFSLIFWLRICGSGDISALGKSCLEAINVTKLQLQGSPGPARLSQKRGGEKDTHNSSSLLFFSFQVPVKIRATTA